MKRLVPLLVLLCAPVTGLDPEQGHSAAADPGVPDDGTVGTKNILGITTTVQCVAPTVEFAVRRIRKRDDAAVAALIREVMPEFGAQGPGFAIMDPEVDAMTAAYAGDRAAYYVIEKEGRLGAMLLDRLIAEARDAGYRTMYLETLENMTQARRLYEKRGFTRRKAPCGATGHHGCDAWYERPL